MEIPTLIYCASGNARFAKIAIDAGYQYGAQLPGTVYYWPYMADQNWKKPDRAAYMAALAKHRPYIASVLDWEREDQLTEVLAWAEDAAQFAEVVMIIPKVHGRVDAIPREIGGKEVRLGFSVPTRFGGTDLHVAEFAGRKAHLLGGSPNKQMQMAHYLNVISADGNYAHKMATKYCQFYTDGTARYARNRYWPTMREENGGIRLDPVDLPYEAFRRSCENIMQAWKNLYSPLPHSRGNRLWR